MPDANPAGAGHHIFISYASKDQELADRIVREIEHRGLTCWISSRDIRPGADFQSSIVAALEHAGIVLLLFSHNANISSEVPKELSLASSRRKPIIPARIEDILPTGALAYQLTHAQFIDLFRNFDNRLNELCTYLAEMLIASGQAERSVRQVTASSPAANAMLAAALGAGVVIVGGMAAWLFVAHPFGHGREAAASPMLSQPAGETELAARNAAFGYYAALSRPADALLPALAAQLNDQVNFYGKLMTRSDLIAVQADYMRRWTGRSFTVRPQSLLATCSSRSQACVVSGIVDYAFRSEQRNVIASGAESFSLGMVMNGSRPAINGIGSTALARRDAALHGARRP
jgi:hypothetical protein